MQIPGRRKDEKFTYLPLYGRQRVFERFADLPDLLHLYALFPTGKNKLRFQGSLPAGGDLFNYLFLRRVWGKRKGRSSRSHAAVNAIERLYGRPFHGKI